MSAPARPAEDVGEALYVPTKLDCAIKQAYIS